MKAKKKIEKFTPTKEDFKNQYICFKELKIAFSIEKTYGGFFIVKSKLNELGESILKSIQYKRIDQTKKDTFRNRVLLSSQDCAFRECFNMYRLFSDKYKKSIYGK